MPTLRSAIALVFTLALSLMTMPLKAQSPDGRIMGIDVSSQKGEDFETAFAFAVDSGMGELGRFFPWNALESSPGVFEGDALADLDDLLPRYGVPLSLLISPVQTNVLAVPEDLVGLPFDDPLVIQRFKDVLTFAKSQLPNTTVRSLQLGNEIDLYFGEDGAGWEEYERFYEAVLPHARSLWPQAKIGVEVTLGGAIGPMEPYYQSMNAMSDVLAISYYPLKANFTMQDPSVIHDDFAALTLAYDLPIQFIELGYPSGDLNNSSEAIQAEFFRQVFIAWDDHAEQIEVVDFTWLHDIPPLAVRFFSAVYGVKSPRWKSYIGTLGLRTFDGQDKEGWGVIVEGAEMRGFGVE